LKFAYGAAAGGGACSSATFPLRGTSVAAPFSILAEPSPALAAPFCYDVSNSLYETRRKKQRFLKIFPNTITHPKKRNGRISGDS
jgi:hypothetical protein